MCHCAGIRPVLAQCCTVLWRLPNSPASADCPPKRSMICFAVFCCVLMGGNLPIKSLAVKPHQCRGNCSELMSSSFLRRQEPRSLGLGRPLSC